MLRSRHAILRWVRFVLTAWALGVLVGVVNGCVAVGGGGPAAVVGTGHSAGVHDDGAHTHAKSAGCTTLCQKSTVGAPETRFDDGGAGVAVHVALVDARSALGAVFDHARTSVRHRLHSLRGSPLVRIAFKRLAL